MGCREQSWRGGLRFLICVEGRVDGTPGNGLNMGHKVKARIKKSCSVSGLAKWVHEDHGHQSSSISAAATFIERVCLPSTEINAL